MFIELTIENGNKEIINADHILKVEKDQKGVVIYFTQGDFRFINFEDEYEKVKKLLNALPETKTGGGTSITDLNF